MAKHTFLVEIGTEELPSKSICNLAKSFSDQIEKEFKIANINYEKAVWFASPRRIAVKITNANDVQSDSEIRCRGPSVSQAFDINNHPTKVAKEWMKKIGITINQIEYITTDKGKWLIYRDQIKGKPIRNLLCDIVNQSLRKISTIEMMRWGDGHIQFVRPVHSVIILLDHDIIEGKVFGVESSRIISGHRFMGESKIYVHHANQYPDILLKNGYVVADYDYRKKMIHQDIEIQAKRLGGIVEFSDLLLDEVTSLVEWPVVLVAKLEKRFLSIPNEIITHIMRNEQKCFPVYSKSGDLLPYFIFVSNIQSRNSKKIITGNERVMYSRMLDVELFYNLDCKKKLEDYLISLNKVLFQNKLGTMYERSNRLEKLSFWIANQIGADAVQSARAGLLSKCDLVTNMVSEFTNIQGIVGMYYAINSGESRAVALAQKEQYYPRFSGDILPTTLISCVIAIADKIDTVSGIFGIGCYPRGEKDPFGLRRAVIGMLRIIIEKKLSVNIKQLISKSIQLYEKKLLNHNKIIERIINFIFDRLQILYHEKGYDINVIKSILVLRPSYLDDFDSRIQAVSYFRNLDKASNLIMINKRISNILAKYHGIFYQDFQASMLRDFAEINLALKFINLRERIKPMFESGCYRNILVEFLELCDPVNIFFKHVMVMVQDSKIRTNRLTLLMQLRSLFLQVADISYLC